MRRKFLLLFAILTLLATPVLAETKRPTRMETFRRVVQAYLSAVGTIAVPASLAARVKAELRHISKQKPGGAGRSI